MESDRLSLGFCAINILISINMETQLIVTIDQLSNTQGGLSRVVATMTEAAAQAGINTHLFALSTKNGGNPIIPQGKSVHTTILPIICTISGFCWTPKLRGQIREKLTAPIQSIIHSHGIWSYTSHVASKLSRQYRIPMILSPHGMLEPNALKHKAGKKSIAWALYQNRNIRQATIFHATSEMEAQNIRRQGFRQPIAVIPNGIHMPKSLMPLEEQNQPKVALFLSRLHPIKGLVDLIDAWAILKPANWSVIIAGAGDKHYSDEVQTRVESRGLQNIVKFIGQVQDEAKWDIYQKADLFILPTYSENFGLVVGEALASAIPVITTKNAPWEIVRSYKCGWWIDNGVAPLVDALRIATSMDKKGLKEMGLRGRKLIEESYSWQKISNDLYDLYKWVLGKGDKPKYILE